MKAWVRRIVVFALATYAAVAAAQDIPLGAGDLIRVQVFGNPDLTLETRVSESGNISYPLLGQVAVDGLSTAAAEKKLADALRTGGFVRSPQVTITTVQLQSRQVSVLGDVNRPGRYPLDTRRTLVDMLALAGGVSPEGGETLQLLRTKEGKTTRTSINLGDMMRTGLLEQNLELSGGDVLYVERSKKFYIYGEVQRPGAYRLERNMTIVQALAAGGGLSPRGTERGIRVKRRNADGTMQIISVTQDTSVQPDDVVYVNEALF